ncbi:hypothetical protein OEZ86_004467 [Tetradesmus obliquus]|nr:hypothetical protein OEZ86_004467 [Tetradesmus obliquus]
MISLLAEQVDYLHNLGTITLLSACDGSSSSSAAADKQTAAVVAALAADVEAYQLLQQLQQVQPPSNASSCHTAAPTPTAAAHAQHPISSSGSGAAAAAAGEGSAVSGTLEDCVMEYGKLCMRVHMGKNQQSVQLSSINLETMCREQPPPGFWASIAECIQPSLTTEQVERLAFGFQVYLEKRAPLVSKSQEIQQQGGGGGGNSSSSSGDSLQCARQLEQLLLGDVSSPEQLDSLLQQLSVCTTQLWEVSRHLIFHWVNTFNTEQMAASITMSFPYWVQPVPLCEYVWRQQQEAYADGPCVSACSKV